MTQCDRILQHMQQHGRITAAEAMQEYGVYRLAARISDLRKAGYRIDRQMVTKKNRYNEAVSLAEYRLEEPTHGS